MNNDGATPIEKVRVNFDSISRSHMEFDDFTIDDLENVLCLAEGGNDVFPKCPAVTVKFSCCDPCRPDMTPFDYLDSDALCVVDYASVSIVDDEKPVIIADNKGVRCSLEPGFNDDQRRVWLQSTICEDTQSPGEEWGVQTDYLSRTQRTVGDGCLDTTEVTYNCMDECRNDADPVVVNFRISDNNPPEIVTPPSDLHLGMMSSSTKSTETSLIIILSKGITLVSFQWQAEQAQKWWGYNNRY